jgi:Mg-chelatase subunit ChlD
MVRSLTLAAAVAAALVIPACDGDPETDESTRPGYADAPYRSEVDEGPGAAVVILLDTSGSMKDPVPGGSLPKHVAAREALGKVLAATGQFLAEHPDRRVRLGLVSFASDAQVISEVADYDGERTRAALSRLPEPDGKTAIGEALDEARRLLYRSGCFRKYILAITDGENTAGAEPETVAREIWRRSEGGVPIWFVAFDTEAYRFRFLKETGGDVVSAQSAAELETALRDIYEGKILAEEMAEPGPSTGR